MKLAAALALIFLSLSACRQEPLPANNSSTKLILVLSDGWTYQGGGPSILSSDADFNKYWAHVNPTKDIHEFLNAFPAPQVGWLHNRFSVPADWKETNNALTVLQAVASEIYFDGKRIAAFGNIDSLNRQTREYDPMLRPKPIVLEPGTIHELFVRIGIGENTRYTNVFENPNPLFLAEIKPINAAVDEFTRMQVMETGFLRLNIGINIMLFIVHFFFFILNREQKANLFLSLSGLCYIIGYSIQLIYFLYTPNPTDKYILGNSAFLFMHISNSMLFLAVYHFLRLRYRFFLWLLGAALLVVLWFNTNVYPNGWRAGATYQILASVLVLTISIIGIRQKKQGAWVFFFGALISLICFSIFATQGTFETNSHFLRDVTTSRFIWFMSFWLSIAASVSAYLAWDFSITSKQLKRKLEEVSDLSARNLAVEKEKQEILSSQKLDLEQKVWERTNELSHSLENLKSTQSQLIQSEKMASLGELTAGIAHEIQNPLNFVNNFSEVNKELIAELQQEADKGNIAEIKSIARDIEANEAKINHHGQRADAIVKSMLEHSRASTGVKEPTDLNKLADEYLRLAYHGMRAKDKSFNASFEQNLDPHLPLVPVVAQDIGRVLLNLYNNAFYAVHEKSKTAGDGYQPIVSVTTELKDSEFVNAQYVIRVTDNGNGIPSGIKDKIFQPFFTTKPTGQGTGLGLSLSYDIIKSHGGTIQMISSETKTTAFEVSIPLSSKIET